MRSLSRVFGVIALTSGLVAGGTVQAADYAREKRWAEEVEPGVMTGEAMYLKAQGRKFLTIYTEAEKPKGAVIVVHGRGVHPNWGLIQPIRGQLAEKYGYTTLSIQAPVMGATDKIDKYEPTYPEASARLEAARQHLASKGHKKIFLVGHSLGPRMMQYYLLKKNPVDVVAMVSVGMTGDYSPALKVPVLDIYGEVDDKDALAGMEKRWSVLRKNKRSKKIVIPGSDHFHAGKEDVLARHIAEYLNSF